MTSAIITAFKGTSLDAVSDAMKMSGEDLSDEDAKSIARCKREAFKKCAVLHYIPHTNSISMLISHLVRAKDLKTITFIARHDTLGKDAKLNLAKVICKSPAVLKFVKYFLKTIPEFFREEGGDTMFERLVTTKLKCTDKEFRELVEKGLRGIDDVNVAIDRKRFALAKTLIRNGRPIPEDALKLAIFVRASKPFLDFLIRQGCDTASDCYLHPLNIRDFDMIDWLYTHGIPWDNKYYNHLRGIDGFEKLPRDLRVNMEDYIVSVMHENSGSYVVRELRKAGYVFSEKGKEKICNKMKMQTNSASRDWVHKELLDWMSGMHESERLVKPAKRDD
jgi:hypothetical protein